MKTFLSCSRNLKTIMVHARIQMIPLNGYLTLAPCHLYTRQPFEGTIPFHKPDLGGIFKFYFRFSCACYHTTCKKCDKTIAIEVNDFGISTCFALKHIQMLICALSSTYNRFLLRQLLCLLTQRTSLHGHNDYDNTCYSNNIILYV